MSDNKIKTVDMEIILAYYFGIRNNLIVPNVSWGMFNYEIDLLILSKGGYATEIEIKVSKSDLLADKNKNHGHVNNMIKYLYFAIPDHIDIDFTLNNIPERSGLICIKNNERVEIIKKPIKNKDAKPFTTDDKFQLARLGAMRIWKLKNTLRNL